MLNNSDPINEGGAPSAPHATHDLAAPHNQTPATSAISDASVASTASIAALANDLEYTLTVGEARSLFETHGRKVPAERTLQNYCIEGTIAAQKIRTTYGSEWLINQGSLRAFIEQQPIVTTAPSAPHATHDLAAPHNQTPATSAISDASVASRADVAAPVGDKRTLGDVLIENAKLLATIEGKDEVIRTKDETVAELKDDRDFLRDEVREAREQRKDVKEIASRMLDAMQNIAIAGKLPPAKNDGISARVIDHQDPSVQHL